ncbi:hypothetical protein DFO47_106124 [Arthrobacter sp. AG258]|uniref:hypothetical protein n=1 Tax=Arthrobacter sp. AG258 TaxID=2183899 RepID=UPI0010D3CE29|nr:hypothetical protein [Arthrobacter sp. AG258]TDT78731.1 hypothetical protein DFO47_106124 [Arthrobacter sp. AG258]
MSVHLNSVRKLRVHWPISAETFSRIAAGNADAVQQDPGLAKLLKAVEQFPDLGDFGNYKHVFESGIGFEGFSCGEGATPTLGRVGEQTLSPTFVFTTYFDSALDDSVLERAMQELVAIHPWELPVIEVTGPLSVAGGLHRKTPSKAAS